jgi:hypothetical protein
MQGAALQHRLAPHIGLEYDIPIHGKAALDILRTISHTIGLAIADVPEIMPPIVEVSRTLLNESYRKACGLSYDDILEPFGKK